MKEKIKRALKNPINMATIGTACVSLAASAMPIMALTVSVDAKKTLGRILGIVCTIFLYLGVLLLVWSIAQLVLAFKNEDADSKSRAIMLIVVSIVLISIKSIVTAVIGTGVTITDPAGF